MSALPPLPEGLATGPNAEVLPEWVYNVSLVGAQDFATTSLAPDLTASFVLTSGYLVFFMHCGFAMISVGCVRAKFAKHIAILVLVDACASALGWYLFGYAFAFGDNTDAAGLTYGNPFIGTNEFAMSNLPPGQYYFWFFEWAFAATACTIVSGAIAERAKFESYIVYSFFMSSWVYPIIVHSIWSSSGWCSPFRNPADGPLLFGAGVIDFAGSGVVHMVGGYAAACGCWILGPRIGRFLSDGTVVDMAGHNTSLFVLGCMILWFGWYGFNPGSQLAIINGNSIAVANAAVTTTLAPAAAGLSALACRALLTYRETGRVVYDLMGMGNGTLAGLAAITAGCSTVYPWGAVCIGLASGVIYSIGSNVMVMLRFDDPLDAIAVHAWNGTWGVLAVGFFGAPRPITASYGYVPGTDPPQERYAGAFYGDGAQLAAQVVYILWLGSWVIGNMLPFFFIINKLGMFRVAAADETTGLDDSYHGGSAYAGGPEEKDLNPGGRAPARQSDIADLRAEIAALKKGFVGGDSNGTKI